MALLTKKQAAEKLSISISTLDRDIKALKITTSKRPGANGKVLIEESQITNYLNTYCAV